VQFPEIESDPQPLLRRNVSQTDGASWRAAWDRSNRLAAQFRVMANAQAVPALATLLMQGLVL